MAGVIQGYYSGKQITILRAMASGHRIESMSELKEKLISLNESTPFFKTEPSIMDAARAWAGNMSSLVVPGSIGTWLQKQPSIPVVVLRLHQTLEDVYKTPQDPTGMHQTGVLLAAIQGNIEPRDDVQRMFVAIVKDLRKTHPEMTNQLLIAAQLDFEARLMHDTSPDLSGSGLPPLAPPPASFGTIRR